ncbi:MAG: ABC transporter substrate-binding protein [Bacteroidota bacterium]
MKQQIKYPVFFLLFLFLWSCKGDQPVVETDTVLDISIRREPKMINPYLNPTALAREVYQYIFLPMADFDPKTYKLRPILIKSIPEGETIEEGPYKGGTKYTIEFKEEAKWDNGSPVTAKDYLFSMKAIKHPGTNAGSYRSYLRWISDIEIDPENDRKATIYFKDYYILAKELAVTMQVYPKYVYDPTNALDEVSLTDISGPNAAEIIKANPKLKDFATEFNSVKFTRETVSNSGPYTLKDWISNQTIILEKKENYWAGETDNPYLQAYPEKIVFHIIPDETSAITQLKEGNIDLMMNVTSAAYLDLKDNEVYGNQFQYLTQELMRFYYIAINNSKPELSDPDVRRALAKLNDIPKLIEVLEDGLGNQTVGIFNSKKEYYNDALKPIELDIEGAKNIFKEEGWADTNNDGTIDKVLNGNRVEMELDIHITGTELSKNVALLLQENAQKAGVKINIITKKFVDIQRDNIKTRDYDLVPLVLGQDLALDDPYSKWHSDNDDPTRANDVSYNSDKADALIDNIRSARDDESRNKYYMELQEVMYEEQPVIFLYNPVVRIILSNTWQGESTLKRPGYQGNTFRAK